MSQCLNKIDEIRDLVYSARCFVNARQRFKNLKETKNSTKVVFIQTKTNTFNQTLKHLLKINNNRSGNFLNANLMPYQRLNYSINNRYTEKAKKLNIKRLPIPLVLNQKNKRLKRKNNNFLANNLIEINQQTNIIDFKEIPTLKKEFWKVKILI